MVEKVIEGKKKGIDTREFEEEIDRLVYWLYGLSEEEVGVIEGEMAVVKRLYLRLLLQSMKLIVVMKK